MKETVRLDLIKILKETLEAIHSGRTEELHDISNHTIHNATTFQDKDSVSIAVVIYSLSKLCHKPEYRACKEDPKFKKETLDHLEKAKFALMKMDIKSYENNMKDLIQAISKIDNQFGFYLTHVMNKARLSKSSKVYEHGLSVGRASELLGISTWELMNYIGNTKISDIQYEETTPLKERLRFTRKLFS